VRFGWSTTTYDRAGVATSEPREISLDAACLETMLEGFRGEVMQVPPPVSAKKVDGQRAYELVRKNVTVELDPVAVHIYELVVLACDGAEVRLRAHCSGGTYMRSIAHELGQLAGCGAHLKDLRRTASGEFEIGAARTLEQLERLAASERLFDALVPASEMLPGMPSVFVEDVTAAQIRCGRNFAASPFRSQPAGRHVKAVDRHGNLVAIGEAVLPSIYHPAVVL
jgi:tRNA pseudouridine55 synthase